MIGRVDDLPVTRQDRALGLARSGVYRPPRPVSAAEWALRRGIDELPLLFPFSGSRMLRDLLRQEGVAVGRGR